MSCLGCHGWSPTIRYQDAWHEHFSYVRYGTASAVKTAFPLPQILPNLSDQHWIVIGVLCRPSLLVIVNAETLNQRLNEQSCLGRHV
jgi:hypothetical protein